VDSPELQKRKSDLPSQPFAEEAKQLSSNLALGKKVSIKLLQKDQYGRAIANVQSGEIDLSMELIQRGLAVLYTGKGAEYDGNRAILESKQEQAKKNGLGVWSVDGFVTPAEFKRQQKLAASQS
jgi:micrococcal nuclease